MKSVLTKHWQCVVPQSSIRLLRPWPGTPRRFYEVMARGGCKAGSIRYEGEPIFLSKALARWDVGLRPRAEEILDVFFARLLLGRIEAQSAAFIPINKIILTFAAPRPRPLHVTCSQTGCSGLAPAPELCPCGARAAATSPAAFVNKSPSARPVASLHSLRCQWPGASLPSAEDVAQRRNSPGERDSAQEVRWQLESPPWLRQRTGARELAALLRSESEAHVARAGSP